MSGLSSLNKESSWKSDIGTIVAGAVALKAITGKLGEKCYELLKYSVFYKASSEEIIEKMGFATANAVKTQKYKCKQKLFKILEENPELNEVIE